MKITIIALFIIALALVLWWHNREKKEDEDVKQSLQTPVYGPYTKPATTIDKLKLAWKASPFI